jgi:formamidopyrimidine-DNA glycosylase
MPELAEVEIVRRNLDRWWTQAASEVHIADPEVVTTGSADDLRSALLSKPQEHRRRGKYLHTLLPDAAVVFHFRMTGKIVRRSSPHERFARIAWRVGDSWLVFVDSRRLGHIDVLRRIEDYGPLGRLGPEPHELTADTLRQRLGKRRLKDALMDQTVVAGIGNIAISEVFWRLRLPPRIKAIELSDKQLEALVDELPRYFDWLIAEEQSDEVLYVNQTDAPAPFDVYQRDGEPCRRCGAVIDSARIGGRSSYFCPSCQ